MAKLNKISRRRFVSSSLSTAALAAVPIPSLKQVVSETMKGVTMTALTPYLLFEGTCYQAMEFYKSCIGGELTTTKVKDTPAKDHMPQVQHEKVINHKTGRGERRAKGDRPRQLPRSQRQHPRADQGARHDGIELIKHREMQRQPRAQHQKRASKERRISIV